MPKPVYVVTCLISILALVRFLPLAAPAIVFFGPLPGLEIAGIVLVGGWGLFWSVRGLLTKPHEDSG